MLGTNDLKPEDSDAAGIADKIIALHAVAHEAGVKTLCIGIPESRITALPPLNETVGVVRSIVNGRLKDWARNLHLKNSRKECKRLLQHSLTALARL